MGTHERSSARATPDDRLASPNRGRRMLLGLWPDLGLRPLAVRWLVWQQDLGRSPRTVEAYARSPIDYLRFCERAGIDVVDAGRVGEAKRVWLLDVPTNKTSTAFTQLLEARAGLQRMLVQVPLTTTSARRSRATTTRSNVYSVI
jgi:hypothetical protein